MIKFPRKIALLTAGLILSLTLLASVAQTANAASTEPTETTESETGISPLSDKTGWRYMNIGTKLFKRLYNYSTGEWIGPWIPVP